MCVRQWGVGSRGTLPVPFLRALPTRILLAQDVGEHFAKVAGKRRSTWFEGGGKECWWQKMFEF